MQERVFLRIGKKPIILIAPHGADDTHTATIARKTAEAIDAYAVINQGFERSVIVDTENDRADCNRIDHIRQPVVSDEFLKPILKFVKEATAKVFQIPRAWNYGPQWYAPAGTNGAVLVFLIHGAGDIVHKQANEPVEVVVGYGLGVKKDSLTCEPWRKNLFIDEWRKVATEGDAFEASGSSNYAGRAANNLNQFFRKHQVDPLVESMQLEFPYSMRKERQKAELTGAKLSVVLDRMQALLACRYKHTPHPKFI